LQTCSQRPEEDTFGQNRRHSNSAFAASGRATSMALQRRVGILSSRRSRRVVVDFNHTRSTRCRVTCDRFRMIGLPHERSEYLARHGGSSVDFAT